MPYAPAGSTPYVAKPKQSDSVSSPATWDPDAYLYKGNQQHADDVKVPYALPEDKVSPSVSNTSDAETSVVVSAKSGTATSQQVKQISAVADGVTKQVTSTDVSSGKVSKTAGTSGKQTTVVETVASVKTNMSTKADNHNSVAAQPASVSAPAVVQTPCELGMRGYVIYNGKCITEYEYSENRRAAQAAAQRTASQNIANAASKINGITSSFKKTVWKNEEGNFNTSRLVSDSVAGVVLGTAGGLITSSVIKKNQVKNGFEDIKCTIGGQTVAEYGDEFRVGVQ